MVKKTIKTHDTASTDDKIAELNAKLQAFSHNTDSTTTDLTGMTSNTDIGTTPNTGDSTDSTGTGNNSPHADLLNADINDTDLAQSNMQTQEDPSKIDITPTNSTNSTSNYEQEETPFAPHGTSSHDHAEVPHSTNPEENAPETNAPEENKLGAKSFHTIENKIEDSPADQLETEQNQYNNDNKTSKPDVTKKTNGIPKNTIKKILPCRIREAGIAENTFHALSKLALPILLLFTLSICIQQFFFPRNFWFSEEVRLADVYMNMLASGDFFHLTLNGVPFGEVGPLYFLSIWAIDNIPAIDMPQAFFGASTFFALLYVAVTWLFARTLGFSKQIAFASGLICLSTFFFVGLSNYSRMDLLYTSCINLSLLCFYRGWKKENGFIWLSTAFIFMAAATLTNGPFAIIMLIVAAILFLLWSGKLKRLNGGDGLLGFILLLLIIFGWLSYLYLGNSDGYIRALLQSQIIQPIFPKQADIMPVWYYAIALPLIFVPWILLIFFVDWWKKIAEIPQIIKSRKENTSSAWLVCIIISGLTLLTFRGEKLGVYLVPILPALSILSAKALLNLSPKRSRFLFALLAIVIFMVGTFFILFEFHAYILQHFPELWIIPQEIPTYINVATTNTYFGLVAVGGLFTILSLILWRFTRRNFAGGSLLVFTLGLIISVQPLSLLVAPQLDTVLSPKTQGEIFAEYKDKGYTPASFAVHPDVYTYYYNIAQNKEIYPQDIIHNIENIADLNHFLSTNPKVILAIPTKKWEALNNKLYSTKIQSQWLESQEIMISLWEAPQLTVMDTLLEDDPFTPYIFPFLNNTDNNDAPIEIELNSPATHPDATQENTQDIDENGSENNESVGENSSENNESGNKNMDNSEDMNEIVNDNGTTQVPNEPIIDPPHNSDNDATLNTDNGIENKEEKKEESLIAPIPLDNLLLNSMENSLLPKANEEAKNKEIDNETGTNNP